MLSDGNFDYSKELQDNASEIDREKKLKIFASIGYALFSSTLLVVNKWAVSEFPFTNIILMMQFCSSTIASYAMIGNKARIPDKRELASFVPCVAIFFATLMTNIMTLKYLGVDMVILLRVLATFLVAIGDWLFNKRKIPSPNSCLCLISIALGSSFVFTINSSKLSLVGIGFGIAYVVCFSIDQVFLKWFTDLHYHFSCIIHIRSEIPKFPEGFLLHMQLKLEAEKFSISIIGLKKHFRILWEFQRQKLKT